ncbi:hypothetical protein [Metabacillus bambusae]|uniref:Uncharacterized protein n=1 Tax=Metabacillus bambusae TaxID=2795218 RepID=A0ABS3MZT9_9BACI|nr:hypothetical protein [Metabacillus bambusae]MBO1511527.1 hypothetical protein [Metabacillus bambusae]
MSYDTENHQSVYCYPGTDVLINKFNIKEQKKLDTAERMHTARNSKLIEFYQKKRDEGKPHKVVMIACSNKLIQ